MKKKTNRYSIIFLGTALEHYDFAVFNYMIPVLTEIFFPPENELKGLIFILFLMPFGVLMRPFGAYFIGRIGDRFGRIKALSISMIGMAVCTGLVAFIPSYVSIGIFAPILLMICRVMQNFFVAGEYIGGAVYILENSKDNKKGAASGLYCAITNVGFICASVVVTLIAFDPIKYWRIPFILGFLTALIGFYIRIKALKVVGEVKQVEVIEEPIYTKENLEKVGKIIAISAFFSGCYAFATYFLNSYIPVVTEFHKSQIIKINSFLLLFYIVIVLMSGRLADRFGARQIMKYSVILYLIISYPVFTLIKSHNIYSIIFLKMVFICMAGMFIGPYHLLVIGYFRKNLRYRLISLAHSLGGLIGNCLAPLAFYLYDKNHLILMPVFLLLSSAIAAFFALRKQ